MSLLAPWMLVGGALAALGVVALHLLTTRRPPPAVLPTARFVPESDVRAVARASRPTDLALLALRALAVLMIGVAFARPVPDAPGPSVRTVFALDLSRSVADTAAARSAVAAHAAAGDSVFPFGAGERVGALSTAFVLARRAAARIARGADSVQLVIVSPVGDGAIDAATMPLRAAWPGRIALERVAAAADTARAPRPGLVTALADDPIRPALAQLPAERGTHGVRIVRGALRAADSLWVRAGRRALLHWPVAAAAPLAAEGVTAFGRGEATLVAPLARLPLAQSPLARGDAPRIVARWSDGVPAVTESPLGDGCVREVGIGIPAGDLTLREPFTRFLGVLVEPCGGARGPALADSALAWLTAPGPLAPGPALAGADGADHRLPFWLIAIALLLLGAESALRRRTASGARA